MTKLFKIYSKLKNNQGATAITVVFWMLFIFVPLAAVAIDLGHLYVVQNELKNAADAGALAGAAKLYASDGLTLEPIDTTNAFAMNAAMANDSEGTSVEVQWSSGNSGDVQRGHWSFALPGGDENGENIVLEADAGFFPNDSMVVINIANYTDEELNAMNGFINAVKVITRRETLSPTLFFAKIFGITDYVMSAESVAYIGFAGMVGPGELDLPIGVCEDSVIDEDGNYTCATGRMVPSTVDTAQWTNFSQDIEDDEEDRCPSQTTDPVYDRGLVDLLGDCTVPINPTVYMDHGVAVNNGQLQNFYDTLYGDDDPSNYICWYHYRDPDEDGYFEPWNVTVLLTDCATPTCALVLGVVNVNIVWMTGGGNDPHYEDAPTNMSGTETYGDWPTAEEQAFINNWEANGFDYPGEARWASFVAHFNLKNYEPENEEADEDGYVSAPYIQKSIYWVPDCTPGELSGVTGGNNYGVLSKIPVLVK